MSYQKLSRQRVVLRSLPHQDCNTRRFCLHLNSESNLQTILRLFETLTLVLHFVKHRAHPLLRMSASPAIPDNLSTSSYPCVSIQHAAELRQPLSRLNVEADHFELRVMKISESPKLEAQCESLRFKLIGGLAVRRACCLAQIVRPVRLTRRNAQAELQARW